MIFRASVLAFHVHKRSHLNPEAEQNSGFVQAQRPPHLAPLAPDYATAQWTQGAASQHPRWDILASSMLQKKLQLKKKKTETKKQQLAEQVAKQQQQEKMAKTQEMKQQVQEKPAPLENDPGSTSNQAPASVPGEWCGCCCGGETPNLQAKLSTSSSSSSSSSFLSAH
ncbi:unnamed protein product [Amoebophrya sp. A120]|nr:unnamed protein product [Amoebophrya sp. A120]|eukprot:GSA120T00015972001.1